MSSTNNIIKYTIIPRNDKEDYKSNFQLSLKEFAKAINSEGSLVQPLILYNSELDIMMDMNEELKNFIIYSAKEDLMATIRREENMTPFRSLIIHGFELSLDEIRQLICPISRRNEIDVCVNVIEDADFDENLTFHLPNDLDELSEEEWAEEKDLIKEDMANYIDEFNMYNDLSEGQMAELIPYLLVGDMAGFDNKMDQIKKDITNDKIIHIPLPSDSTKLDDIDESEVEKVISCSYECDGLIMLSKFDDDFYTIEDDDYEICLTLDQMQFLMESFNRIKDKKIK